MVYWPPFVRQRVLLIEAQCSGLVIFTIGVQVQHLSSELWYRSFWSFFFHLFLKSCYTLLAPTLPVELRDTRVSPCDIVCALVRDEHVEHGSCARTFAGGLVFLPALYGIARSPRLPEHTSLWRCSSELLYLCCVGPLALRHVSKSQSCSLSVSSCETLPLHPISHSIDVRQSGASESYLSTLLAWQLWYVASF